MSTGPTKIFQGSSPMSAPCIAVIEGEGAAPEAMRPTVELLSNLAPDINWSFPPVGKTGTEKYGSVFPPEAREMIDEADATFFGATSGPSGVALAYLRWGRQTFANVRPARWLPGCATPLAHPEGTDFVIVRENLEDLYVGCEGDLEQLEALEMMSLTARKPVAKMGPGKFALKVITREESERIVRFSFDLACRRKQAGKRGRVTCSSKYNMLPQTDGLFRQVAEEIAAEYPDIEFETYIVDDFARRMVAEPQALDVVVLPNLYGDILSDLAAGLIGGLGLAPSGCYGEDFAYFESVHGAAPDIEGRNVINPTATILSGVMMLEYLGRFEEAAHVDQAVTQVYRRGRNLTPDQGGQASTAEFCKAVSRFL